MGAILPALRCRSQFGSSLSIHALQLHKVTYITWDNVIKHWIIRTMETKITKSTIQWLFWKKWTAILLNLSISPTKAAKILKKEGKQKIKRGTHPIWWSVQEFLFLATLTWSIRWTSLLNMDLNSSLASIPILLKRLFQNRTLVSSKDKITFDCRCKLNRPYTTEANKLAWTRTRIILVIHLTGDIKKKALHHRKSLSC
jgi:hypothetical protein